jgi:hypothetical protein
MSVMSTIVLAVTRDSGSSPAEHRAFSRVAADNRTN